MTNIKIGGRLHSTATGNIVTGANEVLDDIQNKKQQEINAELIEAVGTGGSVDTRIENAINSLDATLSQTADANNGGLNLQVTETDGKITSLSGSINPNTYDEYGAASEEATRAKNAETELGGRVSTNESNIEALQEAYRAITQSQPIPKTSEEWAAMTSWEEGVVYRVQGTTSYADYMYNGTTTIKMAEYDNAIDDVPTAGSDNLVKSGGVQEELALGAVYDVSAKNPTGGSNNDGKWESLSALLSDANLNTLIPTAVRKGGMSIKFIQSSDNKYVRYNLLAQLFTTDITQWAIDDGGVYVDNPEYVYVNTDKDGKILWAIEKNGNIHYGAGVPQQVIDYIQAKISELSLDEYEDMVSFLSDYLGSDTTLKVMIDGINAAIEDKLDKEGLDPDALNSVQAVENPEFLEVTLDAEDKVLEGIQKDGTKVIGGDFKVLGNMKVSDISYTVIENPEYLAAWVDADNKIIFGFKADGKTYVGDADFLNDIEDIKAFIQNTIDKNIDWDALTSITATENPEFMDVELDADDKVLSGRKVDGTKFENNDVELNSNATVGGSLEVDGLVIKHIEDPEGRLEIATDSEGKIVSYRKEDGTKVEEKLEVHSITLTSTSIKQLRNDIAVIDWSNKPYIEIDTPKCAIINFSNIATMPTSKTSNAPAYMEFWDMQGNYFKVKTILNAQGDSSLSFTKKNLGIDICTESDNWHGDDTIKVKFGDWVSQDSFHIKAYTPDTFRCSGAICYKLYNQIMETGGVFNDRPYKQYYVEKNTTIDGTGKITQDVETNARCVPDGFPCIVYLNDEFYGVYAFQLKKHRDNYQMKKNNAKHIHLDGTLNATTIFGGTIDWTKFEVRNPKSLKDINGKKYDGDNPKELSDSDAFSAQVKSYIVAMSHYMADIREKEQEYIGGTISITEFKEYINSRFDVKSIINYILFCNVTGNYDGLNKNWQYITYDGVKWFVADYDNDGTFGNYFNGNMLMYPEDSLSGKYDSLLGNNSNIPSYWVYKYYKDELKAKYQVLKEHNVLTTDNIIRLFRDWISAVGVDNYEREYEKWTYQPCYRDPNINTEYWERASFTEAGNQPPVYDETIAYAVGDFVRVKDAISTVYFVFKCIKANTGQPVLNSLYPSEKPSFGHYDSIYRIKNWLDRRIEIFESMLNEL